VQEPSTDIPAGSMPRSVDIILRGDTVDSVKPGDRAIFTGMIIVVPDVVQLMKPGEVLQSQAKTFKLKRNDARAFDGVTGLKRLGVKDLNYKMVFMASTVH
jgi:DNA replication licensing factor MCM6